MSSSKLGLVLPGGGARGAFQVGVLKAVAEVLTGVAAQVRAYAERRAGAASPLGERKYFMVMSDYMQFVADRSTRDLFAKARSEGVKLGTPQPATTTETGAQDSETTSPETPAP